MEFLKDVFGDRYDEFKGIIDTYNNEHKDKPVKLANLTDGGYVAADKYTALQTESQGYKQQLDGITGQLESLKAEAGASEALKTQISQMQEKNKADTERMQAELLNLKRDSAIDLALTKAGARNIKAVKALFDMDKITLDGDTIKGLDEQVTAVKTDNGYLFDDNVPAGAGRDKPGAQKSIEEIGKMTMEEYKNFRKGNN